MKERITRHWERRANAYDQNVREVIYSERDRLAWQQIFADALKGDGLKVLDVGTGPGIAANLLMDMGHEVTGIDASAMMLNRAQENSKELHHSLDLVQGDGECLPFRDCSFDAVVSRYVLWTLPRPRDAIAEFRRVLRPGGRLAIVDGKWFDERKRSLHGMIWRNLSLVLILLTERRLPCYEEMDPEVRDRLWSCNEKRPEADAEMLMGLGFRDVRVVDDLNRRLSTTMNHLKHGYGGSQFLVAGIR